MIKGFVKSINHIRELPLSNKIGWLLHCVYLFVKIVMQESIIKSCV